MEILDDVIFYHIDKAIRTYRQYAQHEIRKAGYNLTIDQWLLLSLIKEKPEISQRELADGVFKDGASINRMLELLVQSGYVKKKAHASDQRKYSLILTASGLKALNVVAPIVSKNRKQALKGIDTKKIKTMKKTLQSIQKNCVKTED